MRYWRPLALMAAIFALPLVLALVLHVSQVRSMATYEPPPPLKTHVVTSGDTLWRIAREYYPQADPRAVVYAIQALNDVRPERLRPGDILILPKEVP